jgi:hypothetical protein
MKANLSHKIVPLKAPLILLHNLKFECTSIARKKNYLHYIYLNMPEESILGLLRCAGILEQSVGARNRVGIWLSYRPARLHRMAELIPWNRFLGSLNV